jgi:predicted DsbA family dithiol-disulfide isomerase
MNKAQFYAEKFGPERTAMIHKRLRSAGEDTGIAFKFGGRIGNTRDSHRLIHLAKKYGEEMQLKTIDGLFSAHFENEGDITSYEVLRRIATDAGISNEVFQKAIVDSDEGGKKVEEQTANARAGGVNGVPYYKILGKFELSGARDITDFLRVFEKVKAIEQ